MRGTKWKRERLQGEETKGGGFDVSRVNSMEKEIKHGCKQVGMGGEKCTV